MSRDLELSEHLLSERHVVEHGVGWGIGDAPASTAPASSPSMPVAPMGLLPLRGVLVPVDDGDAGVFSAHHDGAGA